MKILKHVAMAGLIMFLLNPDRNKHKKKDIHDTPVVVIDEDGEIIKAGSNTTYDLLRINPNKRTLSELERILEIKNYPKHVPYINGVFYRGDKNIPLSEIDRGPYYVFFLSKTGNV